MKVYNNGKEIIIKASYEEMAKLAIMVGDGFNKLIHDNSLTKEDKEVLKEIRHSIQNPEHI